MLNGNRKSILHQDYVNSDIYKNNQINSLHDNPHNTQYKEVLSPPFKFSNNKPVCNNTEFLQKEHGSRKNLLELVGSNTCKNVAINNSSNNKNEPNGSLNTTGADNIDLKKKKLSINTSMATTQNGDGNGVYDIHSGSNTLNSPIENKYRLKELTSTSSKNTFSEMLFSPNANDMLCTIGPSSSDSASSAPLLPPPTPPNFSSSSHLSSNPPFPSFHDNTAHTDSTDSNNNLHKHPYSYKPPSKHTPTNSIHNNKRCSTFPLHNRSSSMSPSYMIPLSRTPSRSAVNVHNSRINSPPTTNTVVRNNLNNVSSPLVHIANERENSALVQEFFDDDNEETKTDHSVLKDYEGSDSYSNEFVPKEESHVDKRDVGDHEENNNNDPNTSNKNSIIYDCRNDLLLPFVSRTLNALNLVYVSKHQTHNTHYLLKKQQKNKPAVAPIKDLSTNKVKLDCQIDDELYKLNNDFLRKIHQALLIEKQHLQKTHTLYKNLNDEVTKYFEKLKIIMVKSGNSLVDVQKTSDDYLKYYQSTVLAKILQNNEKFYYIKLKTEKNLETLKNLNGKIQHLEKCNRVFRLVDLQYSQMSMLERAQYLFHHYFKIFSSFGCLIDLFVIIAFASFLVYRHIYH